jgi:glycerol uptake facilitator-like aquaporin
MLAEDIGTALLVLFGAGSVAAALTVGGGQFYLIGPVAGAVLAAFAHELVARPRVADTEPPQGAAGDITGRRE